MTPKLALIGFAFTLVASCATGQAVPTPGDDAGTTPDASTGGDAIADVKSDACGVDQDSDGVPDCQDKCPSTPAKATVNKVGCADTQLTAKLDPTWPPYGLTWTSAGDMGRAGGMTWTYTGIQRADLFHIDWIICDDPKTPCGVSLDGPIDVPGEKWAYSATDSDLPNGKIVFTNTTGVYLADGSTRPLTGRLTVTIVDGNNAPTPFADIATLGVTALDGKYGAEIKGTGFKVTVLGEVEDTLTNTWTPYLDYYDAAPTFDQDGGTDAGGNLYQSFGGSFYDK